jgi:hypothetical protein
MTFGYQRTLFVRMCGTIDPGHTYDEYMVLLAKSGMTHPVFLPRGSSVLLVADTPVVVVSYIVASVAKTLSRSYPSWVEVHWRWGPQSVPPCPWGTWWIHHQRRPPRPRHWWPEWEVRRQMIILLTTISTF